MKSRVWRRPPLQEIQTLQSPKGHARKERIRSADTVLLSPGNDIPADVSRLTWTCNVLPLLTSLLPLLACVRPSVVDSYGGSSDPAVKVLSWVGGPLPRSSHAWRRPGPAILDPLEALGFPPPVFSRTKRVQIQYPREWRNSTQTHSIDLMSTSASYCHLAF